MASINIGETLREARKKKNISLDELQKKTKIQKRYLSAIEENDFEQLPSKFYVRNFIRQYAETVGVDSDQLVDAYDGKEEAKAAPVAAPKAEVTRKLKHEDPRARRLQTSMPAIALGLIAIAIIAVVGYTTWLDHKDGAMITASSSMKVEGSTSLLTESSEKAKAEAAKKKAAAEKAKAEEQKKKAAEKAKESTEQSKTAAQKKATAEQNAEAKKAAAEKKKADAKAKEKAAAVKKYQTELEEGARKKTTFAAENNSASSVDVNVGHVKSPATITFTGKDEPCWVGIMVNDQLIYQYTLQAGETQTTEIPTTTDTAMITVGVANRVGIKLNNKKLDFHPGDSISQKNINLKLSYRLTDQQITEHVEAFKANQEQTEKTAAEQAAAQQAQEQAAQQAAQQAQEQAAAQQQQQQQQQGVVQQ